MVSSLMKLDKQQFKEEDVPNPLDPLLSFLPLPVYCAVIDQYPD